MTNEVHEQSAPRSAVEVTLKSYSGKPETEDGYDITVRAEATKADVDRVVMLALHGRFLARLGIAFRLPEEVEKQVADTISAHLLDEAAAQGVEVSALRPTEASH